MTYAGEKKSGDSLDVLLAASKRKPNFTEGESLFLISQFERNSGVLASKLNDTSTIKQMSKFGSVYAVITTAGIRSFHALQTISRENEKTWSVQQKRSC